MVRDLYWRKTRHLTIGPVSYTHLDVYKRQVLEGLDFIQLLRLRHQYLEGEPGRQGDNLINPDNLNELDRRILKESFRQARKIQTLSLIHI